MLHGAVQCHAVVGDTRQFVQCSDALREVVSRCRVLQAVHMLRRMALRLQRTHGVSQTKDWSHWTGPLKIQ